MTTFRERRENEAKKAREALHRAGINALVRYGRGTASNWLEIFIGNGEQFGEHVRRDVDGERGVCAQTCPRCAVLKALEAETARIVFEATGRDSRNVSISRTAPKESKRPIVHAWQPPTEPDEPPPAAAAALREGERTPLRLVTQERTTTPARTFIERTFTISYPADSAILWRWYCDAAEVVGTIHATVTARGRKVLIVTTDRSWTTARITEFFAERDMSVIVGTMTVTDSDLQQAA